MSCAGSLGLLVSTGAHLQAVAKVRVAAQLAHLHQQVAQVGHILGGVVHQGGDLRDIGSLYGTILSTSFTSVQGMVTLE